MYFLRLEAQLERPVTAMTYGLLSLKKFRLCLHAHAELGVCVHLEISDAVFLDAGTTPLIGSPVEVDHPRWTEIRQLLARLYQA